MTTASEVKTLAQLTTHTWSHARLGRKPCDCFELDLLLALDPATTRLTQLYRYQTSRHPIQPAPLPPRHSATMADEQQEDGILRYLKDMVSQEKRRRQQSTRAKTLTDRQDYKFHEPLGQPGIRFEYDLKPIARDAMTRGAQLCMTNASFPQELRLQIMRASVVYHSSTFKVTSWTISDDYTSAVTSLFDTQHTNGALHDMLMELGEQALFEAAIFRVHMSLSSFKPDTAPLLLDKL